MRLILILLSLTSISSYGQLPKIAVDWEREIIEQFDTLDINESNVYDFAEILLNQLRIDRDPWSTYIGVFGPLNRRIDFHLQATKIFDEKYSVLGKSKIGDSIGELSGMIYLRRIVQTPWDVSILLFKYILKKPENKDGNGFFTGIGSVVFKIENDKPKMYWNEAGEFRDFNNMFVGIWNRYNSDISKECIFSFNPSGTHNKLPYRDYLYKEFQEEDECKCYFEIKNEFRQYGWENYDDSNEYKDYWWRK
ncbi:MAG: hypothetical protein Q8T08_06190 [Ignavibacteria bacterium]|nr:hypothetical protein [Ignavibacteria bacterium]